ncbi:MAG: Polypeptide-transport-associated domain protein FtsQ-type [Verrucomicrobia bacterium]|nr:Polypeptide-transport-associated domain protein FtsQ-type [Verrucomicrobiota bacterium]
MNPLHSNLTPARHWKDIPQEVSHRAMSSEGRRRAVFAIAKTAGLMVTLAALGWGGLQLVAVFRDDPKDLSRAVRSAPLKDLVLTTDGTLDQAWLARALALPKDAPLMALDLFQLRTRLLACGQVRSATLTRNFPSTLAVTVAERPPVARLQVQGSAGTPQAYFVGRDGVVFEGINPDPKMVETLPWLSGVKLMRQGGVFQPLAGMDVVADLLARAKLEAEHLYAGWRSVSLARLQSDGEIEVTTKDGSRIVFGTNEDFFRQLANLDAIVDAAKEHPEHVVRDINLTVGGQVPVAFNPAAAEPAPAAEPGPAPSKTPLFTGFNHP